MPTVARAIWPFTQEAVGNAGYGGDASGNDAPVRLILRTLPQRKAVRRASVLGNPGSPAMEILSGRHGWGSPTEAE